MKPGDPHSFSLAEALRHSSDTRTLEIGEKVLEKVPEIFAAHFSDLPAILVADPNTFAAAGQAVQAAFSSRSRATREPFIFRDPGLYAEHRFVNELEQALRGHNAIPIAVGSGTINDLTKLAAHRSGRRYLCVSTAASMDGYTAFGASITYQGSKQTFLCPAPIAVVADLGVIRNAPSNMTAWGYADLAAKITAGADWILADALGVEPLDSTAWSIVQGRLQELIAEPAMVKNGDSAALARLIEGLMLGGFAMQVTQSSRPASGSEHQLSHLWDMQHHLHEGHVPSHGFKVGIGTLAVTALYEYLLEQPLCRLDVDRCCLEWPTVEEWQKRAREIMGSGEVTEVALKELAAKQVTIEVLRQQLTKVRQVWPELRVRLRQQLLPMVTLRQMLSSVGAPVEPEEIGISRERLRRSYWQAFCIRRRFTVLDLAVRTGMLPGALDSLFGLTPHPN